MKDTQDFFYIKETINGNTEVYSFLVDKYKNYVFTICNRILKNNEDAEEIAQDTFIKAYKELATFQGNSKFSTWLYTIAFRLSISKTRKNKIHFFEIDADNSFEKDDDISLNQLEILKNKEQKKYINLALDKLPEQDSILLTLYYLNEKSIDEISEIVDLTQSNIKVKLFRARKKMYSELHLLLNTEIKSIL